MKYFLLIIVYVFLAACVESGDASVAKEPLHDLKVGSITYLIPNKYVLPDLPASMVPEAGLDNQSGILIRIPLQDLGISDRYNSGDAMAIQAHIYLSPVYSSEPFLKPSAQEAWKGVGLYSERIIKYDETVGLYRVYPKKAFPTLWHYFKVDPTGDSYVSDAWIGRCNTSPFEKEGLITNARCSFFMKHKEAEISFSLFGDDVKNLSKIIQKFKILLSTWEVK